MPAVVYNVLRNTEARTIVSTSLLPQWANTMNFNFAQNFAGYQNTGYQNTGYQNSGYQNTAKAG